MKRKILSIDHDKCNGCGLCIPSCPEGAIQLIDGKARLVSDQFCDGLGACLGTCPEGAITILEREAEPYSEELVMENIIPQGEAVIRAHEHHHQGCPGSRSMVMEHDVSSGDNQAGRRPSRLESWPVQLHLIPPRTPHFKGRYLLLSADCAAYTAGDFHKDHLAGKVLAIACPKLDEGLEIYREKLIALIDEAGIASLTVLTMEVPCCSGLVALAREALAAAKRKDVPLVWKVMSIRGEIIREESTGARNGQKPVLLMNEAQQGGTHG